MAGHLYGMVIIAREFLENHVQNHEYASSAKMLQLSATVIDSWIDAA